MVPRRSHLHGPGRYLHARCARVLREWRPIPAVYDRLLRFRIPLGTLVCDVISSSTSVGHWSVTVRKMPAGSGRTTYRSNVTFATRRIELDTADLAAGGAANDAGASTPRFRSPPHEFGHTLSLPDEYSTGSPDLADSGSIMNIGRAIRQRHLALIVTELNKMMPGVTFVAPLSVP